MPTTKSGKAEGLRSYFIELFSKEYGLGDKFDDSVSVSEVWIWIITNFEPKKNAKK